MGGSREPLRLCRDLSPDAQACPLHWKELEKAFVAAGFVFVRQKGSHRSYAKAGMPRPVVIPAYAQVPVSIIRNNLKTANISHEEYFALLRKK